MNCWKCNRRIDENYPEWAGDGMCYPTFPPKYAHAACPPKDAVEPKSPISLVARHCRTCDSVILGREDLPTTPTFNMGVLQFSGQGSPHKSPSTGEVCKDPDFGPGVGVVAVPW